MGRKNYIGTLPNPQMQNSAEHLGTGDQEYDYSASIFPWKEARKRMEDNLQAQTLEHLSLELC